MFIDLSSWCLIEYTCDYVVILILIMPYSTGILQAKRCFQILPSITSVGVKYVRCKDLLELFCEYDNYFAK